MKRLLCLAWAGFLATSRLLAQEPALLRTLSNDSESVDCVAFTPDGRTLVSGGDERIRFWEVATGKKVSVIVAEDFLSVRSVAISPDGKALASVGYCSGTIKLWDLASRKNTATIEPEPLVPNMCAAFSQDGKILVTVGDGTLRHWDVASGKNIVKFEVEAGCPVSFSRDGRIMAATRAGRICLWNVATRNCTVTLKADFYNHVTALALKPDGKILASVGEHWNVGEQISPGTAKSREITLWDVASGKNLAALRGHMDAISSVAFSPDGKSLASGSRDRTIKLWDLATGKNTATLKGHTEAVNTLDFSPDGKILASGSRDGTIKLWDVMVTKNEK